MVFVLREKPKERCNGGTEATTILNFTSKLNPLSEAAGSSFPLSARMAKLMGWWDDDGGGGGGCPVITGK